MDARQLYVQAKTAGYLYQAQLRAELSKRLGVEWTRVHNGAADLEGVPRSVIRSFSKRRAEIEAALADAGAAEGRELQTAALMTRKAKDYGVSPADLLAERRSRAERLGLDDRAWGGVVGRTLYRPVSASLRTAIADELASAEGLTASASSFTRREAIQGFCNKVQQGADVTEIEQMADAFLDSEHSVVLASPGADGERDINIRAGDGRSIPTGVEETRFSTPEMLAVEQQVIERAIERRFEGVGPCADPVVDAALAKRPTLYPDQQSMVRQLATSGQGVEIVVGKAGAGKTFALDAARDAWENSGYAVVGCSLSARAAEELQHGSGIRSYTVAALLRDLDNSGYNRRVHRITERQLNRAANAMADLITSLRWRTAAG